ncbi:hypothetical protein CCUS01_10578 [Colletotrichum cuscutae]|uniref:Uncharacterized protein n=1 Tax=Colletotrichum cuscutae TaxID=1209917 RepID=A0AAI9U9K2_9PEZI|nr:hypothetical protein CCUS01_10578 [Colletotrichum cuscutae]
MIFPLRRRGVAPSSIPLALETHGKRGTSPHGMGGTRLESPTYAGAMFVRAAPNWTPALAKRQTNPDSATLGQRPVPTLNPRTLSLSTDNLKTYPVLECHVYFAYDFSHGLLGWMPVLIPYLSQTPLYLDPVGLGQKGSQETARHRILFSRLRLREKDNPESRGKRSASTSSSGPSSIIPAAVAV